MLVCAFCVFERRVFLSPCVRWSLLTRYRTLSGSPFKTSLKNALLNFASAAEAKRIVERADKDFFISRRTEFVDLGNNRGNAPVNYWKKECRFCRATFEITDLRQAYCDAPGHRQRYYEVKKSAELFLEVVGVLEEDNRVLRFKWVLFHQKTKIIEDY